LRLSNHSYGTGPGWSVLDGVTKVWNGEPDEFYDPRFGSYGEFAAQLDSLAYLHKEYLSVWAAGNDRNEPNWSGFYHFHNDNVYTNDSHAADTAFYSGYRTVTPESTAKNIITVGSIYDLPDGWQSAATVTNSSFSNWGPTRDGRLKPDLVANGQEVYSSSTDATGNDTYSSDSGTSPAAASVTGSIALLRERFAEVGNHEPSAALMKALLLITADEAGAPGPDYQFGYGVMNTARAASLILTNTFFFNYAGGPLKSHFLEGVLTNGATISFTLDRTVGTELRAMLVWTDPSAYYSPGPTNLMLVNDLDLKIIRDGVTNGSYYLNPSSPPGSAAKGNNFRDNSELNVWASTNVSGQLTVQISHKGTLLTSNYGGTTTNQPFALVVTGHTLEPVPEIISIAQTSSNQVTLAWSGVLYRQYKVQYIDDVDAPAAAWSDATGAMTMTVNPAAVALTMPTNAPTRFYRVIRLF